MKKNLLVLTLFFSVLAFAQSEEKYSKTMGFYISPNFQVGYNLGNSIKDSQHKNNAYYQQYISPYLPNDFTYGVGVVGGYQLLSFFALGTGIKYNYISDTSLGKWQTIYFPGMGTSLASMEGSFLDNRARCNARSLAL